MVSPAESAPGAPCEAKLLSVKRYKLEAAGCQEKVQFSHRAAAESGIQHKGSFEHRYGRDLQLGGACDSFPEALRIRLSQDYRQKSGGIDNH